jgi:NAD-dependent dihydropyrimidine dehydrogenase PreA subunit
MVHINKETCIGCKLCIPYCTVNAISVKNDEVVINQQECVECQVCLRAQVCPTDALYTVELEQSRKIREISNPTIRKLTGIPGRGTEEVKTNDVTGRIKRGELGLCIDVGRPNIGTTIEDVEKIAMALAQVGLIFEKQNPCTALMKDSTTGEFNSSVKNQKVLSIIIEGKSTIENIPCIISALKNVEKKVNTVFSVGLICRVGKTNRIPVLPILEELGIPVRPNGKTNVGLGKPLISI